MKEDQRLYRERIVTDPRILAGKPVVKGTRIAVDLVLEELSHNPDIGELLAAHPDLTRTDVQACLAYAKDMVTGEEVSPKPPKGVRSDAPTVTHYAQPRCNAVDGDMNLALGALLVVSVAAITQNSGTSEKLQERRVRHAQRLCRWGTGAGARRSLPRAIALAHLIYAGRILIQLSLGLHS